MSSDVAISVRGLSKKYTIRHNQARHTTMGEALVYRLRHPFESAEREEFWALNDVSFDVKQGEVLGVIGRNGAGKSTLLKILSRITAPTEGEIHLYGRVASLLEVGTGFHPELTGRENIYLNGSILGMRRREIERRFDEIVDFAGVEQFLDTPVKRYSSGMYVRLAFAVAAHLETDVLLVDEVLAVGDAEFQEKSLSKMNDLGQLGRTILLVSHNMSAVRQFASQACLLDRGTMALLGHAPDVLAKYATRIRESSAPHLTAAVPLSEGVPAVIHGVDLVTAPQHPDYKLLYRLYVTSRMTASYFVSHSVLRDDRAPVASGITSDPLTLVGGEVACLDVTAPLPHLAPGSYSLNVALADRPARNPACYAVDAAQFDVAPGANSTPLERIWEPKWGTVVLKSPSVEIRAPVERELPERAWP